MSNKRLRDVLVPKLCSRCKEVKDESGFTPTNWKRKSGYCKSCANEYYRGKRRSRAVGYSYIYIKRRRRELSWMVMEYKSERGCMFCGEKHPAALDLHHRDPSEKTMHIRGMVDRTRPIAVIKSEMEKCDVVCSNCHRKLHYLEGGRVFWAEGTLDGAENQDDLAGEVRRRQVKYPVTLTPLRLVV